ncbi:MAG: NlpC/P60 family protein [Candidatus Ornithomonoglobus sp.]
MTENSKLPKMRLLILIAALSAGLGQFGMAAHAEGAKVSERDMLDQAVALYEKLCGQEVEVPAALADSTEDPVLAKAVVLGFANADELDSIADGAVLRKQDVMTVLYKTIIDFDDSFALSTEEVDEIMNKCYDNALVDEQNRVGYAFMIKHGIIIDTSNSEPNKEINWNSCKIIVNVLYDLFMQDISFNVDSTEIKIGSNINSVTDILGEPDRIDKSDYIFDWYVYNSDYNNFMMIGVNEGRICAFCSNGNFSFADISSGDDYIKIYQYLDDDSFRFFEDGNGKLDAVIYNPLYKDTKLAKNSSDTRAAELVDLINANRVKNGLDTVSISSDLWHTAMQMASQPKYISVARDTINEHISDNAEHETGYDICSIYAKLLKNNNECFSGEVTTVGVGTSILDDYSVMASVTSDSVHLAGNTYSTSSEDIASLPTIEPTQAPTEAPAEEPTEAPSPEPEEHADDENTEDSDTVFSTISSITLSSGTSVPVSNIPAATALPTEAPASTTANNSANVVTAAASSSPTETPEPSATDAPTEAPTPEPGSPEVISPVNEEVINDGDDVVVELKESAADEYFVQIYSIEDDEYIVNSYIKTTDTTLTFEASLFEVGKDYSIKISAVKSDGTLDGKEFIIQYGEAPEGSVRVTTSETTTDNDFIELSWESDIYHDFVIDIYDNDGKLLLSQPVTDAKSAKINNIDPGDYYIYVSAIRRGDKSVVKTNDNVNITVELPEPILTEYILDDGEKFYPIYDDEEMGLVYFYDEDIIDVEVPGKNEKTTTVKRKKITEKCVKATTKYKALASAQQKVEYFEGSDELQIIKPTTVSAISASGLSSATGDAICQEAAKYLGVPYLWGGTTPAGFDCSGFVQYVFKSLGIEISRTTYTQVNEGTPVSKDELQPGDLLFFGSGLNVHHVGIYVGNNTMIHAPYTGTVIQYQSIDTPYYTSEFSCARRFTN